MNNVSEVGLAAAIYRFGKDALLVADQRRELLIAAKAIVNSTDYDEDLRPLMQNLRAAIRHAEENT